MPPPSSSQQGSQNDNSLSALWLCLLVFAALALIWYLFHEQIVWLVFQLKYFEACFMGLFVSPALPFAQAIQHLNPASVDLQGLWKVAYQGGYYFRYPVCLILLLLTALLFYTHPSLRYKKIHNMKTLYEQEKFNWPQIMPIAEVNLLKGPLEKGPWAMSLTPMQFAKKHQLIIEEHQKGIRLGEQRERINVVLAQAQAHQVFALQLGQVFQGVDSLSLPALALFTVFAARALHDQAIAKKILDQLSISSFRGQLNFSGVRKISLKYSRADSLKKIMDKHAYVLTFMASMLEAARKDGVLAAADFLWVKTIDRSLWYMLSSVGRQTAFPEVGGPFAHWLAEKKLGKKISTPMVDEAVKSLEIALKEVIYEPDKPASLPSSS